MWQPKFDTAWVGALPLLSPLASNEGMKAFWRTQRGALADYYFGLLA